MALKDISATDLLELLEILDKKNNENCITRRKILITGNNSQNQNEE